ncbi:MAG: PD-(D/E)XK nuclease family protein [Planctomycetia bacterium]|nr:PD-(D/E)XK nuclease family protein [Planctomycetia bacterium]
MDLLFESLPGDVAVELTGRDYLSYSAVTTYQSCPLRYYFRYVLGLPEETVSSALVFGSAIHAALERFYRERMQGNSNPPLDLLQEAYQMAWRRFDDREIRFGKEEDQASLDNMANRILTTFHGSELACTPGRILGIEEEFRGELIPGCPDILARVDLLIETPDALVVTDFKTSRSRWNPEHVDESAGQLLLYHDLVRPLAEGRSIRLEFVVVTKTKIPDLTRHAVNFDRQRIERTKRIVKRVWTAIQSGLFYPVPSAMNCGGCPFRKPCRDWTG